MTDQQALEFPETMRVVDLRDSPDHIAATGQIIGRSSRWVKRELVHAHGSTLLCTLFEDYLPEDEAEEEAENDPLEGATPEETHDRVLAALREWQDREIRNYNFGFPRLERDGVQPLMDHQAEALSKVERNGFASGIIHLPTGAGKTRTALELMARLWERDERTLFIWASHGKNLVRQSMIRLAELLPRFSRELYVAWLEASDPEQCPDRFHDANVLFATRDTLTKLLDRTATLRRKDEPLRALLTSTSAGVARPVVIIYDECHEIGAAGLQKAWRKFHDKVLTKHKRASRRFRVFGLSATPMPTTLRPHKLLQDVVFPIRPQTTTEKDCGVLVHATASMRQLIDRNILCKINEGIQSSGRFNIPDELLDAVLDDEMPRLPSRSGLSDRQWVNEFSKRFNRHVMSDPRILDHLADRLAEDFETIGKAIVFCATIAAAHRGYRPTLGTRGIPENDLHATSSLLSDEDLAPVVEDGAPQVPADPKMDQLDRDVRAALREFLHGEAFDAARLAEILSSEVQLEYGPEGHVFRPATEHDVPRGFRATLERRVALAEEKLEADLAWFFQQVPAILTETNIAYTLKMLEVGERHELRVEEELKLFLMARLD